GVRDFHVTGVQTCALPIFAFPVRFSHRLIVAAIDARRGELYYAFYRQVPGGVQRLSEPELGSPDDLASEIIARGEECLLVGDGRSEERREGKECSHGRDGL